MAHTFTEANFEAEVLKSDVPVLVDFWAPWCGPCRVVSPAVEEVAAELEGKGAKVGKLNVDENGNLSQKYGILSIPTLMIFKNGQVVNQLMGIQTKEKIADALKQAM